MPEQLDERELIYFEVCDFVEGRFFLQVVCLLLVLPLLLFVG